MTAIRVLCVDDHRIVREGIGLIIDREPDMQVVGSAATGEEAVALFARERPDVTLMDLQLPTMSGLDAIRSIRRTDPDARIVVLTMYQATKTSTARVGRRGDVIAEGHAVRRRSGSCARCTPGKADRADVKARLDERAAPTLTPREIQVMGWWPRRRNKEIASLLSISEETVRST